MKVFRNIRSLFIMMDQEIKELRAEVVGLRREVQRIQEHLFGKEDNRRE